jgi:hypothetical protein
MKWIKCSERLPKPNEAVLAHDTQRTYLCFMPEEPEYNEHWVICEECCCSCTGCTGAIVAWMPLPESPLEEYETKWGRKYREVKDNSNEMD